MKVDTKNIPAELTERNQWVLWKLINRNGNSTKIPYQVSGNEAKSNDSTTWASFDDVLTAYNRGGYSGIGFVFSKDDPYCGIDLDGCYRARDGVSDWAQEIIKKLDSYSEISPSGSGIKIFVCAKSPFDSGKNKKLPQFGDEGGKEAGIEIYDFGRFFCVTGQVLPEMNVVKSCELGWIQSKYWPDTMKQPVVPWKQPMPIVPISNPISPLNCLDTLRRASLYLAECEPAVQGQNGHSKLFWAAGAMTHGCGLSDSQAYDILSREFNPKCVPPWDLSQQADEKDFRRKITESRKHPPDKPHLWIIIDQSFAPVDTSRIDVEKLISNTISKKQVLAVNDPAGPIIARSERSMIQQMPLKLRNVPGFLNEYIAHCMDAAPYPNEILALAGGLALLSTITGRKIQSPTGLRTNLYVIALALPGTGKNFPRTLNSQLLEAAGAADLLADRMASSEGVEDRLSRNPVVLFQTDEVDYMIDAMEKAKDNRYHALASLLNELYTASGGLFPRRAKADQNTRGNELLASINQPHLVLFGTAIPQHYYKAIGSRLLENGFCARTLAIEADPRSRGKSIGPKLPPERLIEEVRFWINFRPPHAGDLWDLNPTPATIPATQAAWEAMRACQSAADRQYSVAERSADAGAAAIWSRVYEQTLKLATLYAASENHYEPKIDRPAVEWASGVAEWQAKRSLALAGEYSADSPFQEGCKRFLRTVISLGGKATRRQVCRKMNDPVKSLDEYVRALVDQGRIVVHVNQIPGKSQIEYESLQTSS